MNVRIKKKQIKMMIETGNLGLSVVKPFRYFTTKYGFITNYNMYFTLIGCQCLPTIINMKRSEKYHRRYEKHMTIKNVKKIYRGFVLSKTIMNNLKRSYVKILKEDSQCS